MELGSLNNRQKEAVLYNDGPLLIIAGAGAGKTKTLTTKIAYLIEEESVHPYNILAITFTNKAAKEMKDRLYLLIGDIAKKMGVSEENTKNVIPVLLIFLSCLLTGFGVYDKIAKFAKAKKITNPTLVVPMDIRHMVFVILAEFVRNITVLAHEELVSDYNIKFVGKI